MCNQSQQEQANGAALVNEPLFDAAAQDIINRDTPEYLRIYMNGFARAHERMQHAINGLHARIDSVERSIKETDTQHKAEFASIRNDIAGIAKTVDDSSIKENPCEVVVRGLPPALALTNKQITTALLTALQLPDYAQHVVGWREWTPKKRAEQLNPAQQATSQALGEPAQPQQNHQPVRSLAFNLSSSFMCDSVLKNAPLLRNLTCQAIFGTGGESFLSVNALWPTQVYVLLKRAIAVYRQLGYARPIVRNLTVFVRPTKTGPPVPIPRESDVDALVNAMK